jgi:hypothetical protein
MDNNNEITSDVTVEWGIWLWSQIAYMLFILLLMWMYGNYVK